MIVVFKTFFCVFGSNRHDNVYNEEGERVFETIATQKFCLGLRPAEKETTAKDTIKKTVEAAK
ncbi:hypothetical protein CLU79DRAFT_686282, partial [Phycomyces nitens]